MSRCQRIPSLALSIVLVACLVPLFGAPARAQNDLSGTYRIRVVADDLYWHEDGFGDQLVSTRYQEDDPFTQFTLIRQPDGSYRILAVGSGLFLHEDGGKGGDQLLSTRYQETDDFTRFFFERQNDGSFRIRVKATGLYLHEDRFGDQLLSTRFQEDDDFTRFRLEAPGCFRDENTACLVGGRFRVSADTLDFSNPPNGPGALVPGRVQRYRGERAETDQTVSFYSFEEGSVELFVKVLDACSFSNTFWVFAAGATNAEATVTIVDTFTGETYVVANGRGQIFTTVADTQAFATCSASP